MMNDANHNQSTPQPKMLSLSTQLTDEEKAAFQELMEKMFDDYMHTVKNMLQSAAINSDEELDIDPAFLEMASND